MKISIEEARRRQLFATSETRMEVMLGMWREMNLCEWLTVLGEAWSCCDVVTPYKQHLRCDILLYGPSQNIPEMMTIEELATLQALPKIVEIYRGCDARNRHGICWSLDRDVAVKFATYFWRYRTDNPLLITAKVARERIIALKTDRDEREVIAFAPKVVGVERLELATAA